MGTYNKTRPVTAEVVPAPPPSAESGNDAVTAWLQGAAAMAIEQGIDLETFVRSAWGAFVDAQPGMREHLEAMQLLMQLQALRDRGHMPKA